MLSPSFPFHFFPLIFRACTRLCSGAVRVGSCQAHAWEPWAALHSTGIDMDSQSRLASSCYWNCYAVKWFLSRFCWITEEWEGDWMGGWSWRCKERPANFCSICCTTIEPLVLTWLNAALPLGSHRLLYCVIISILKKHLLLSYCQFNCVPPWGSQEGDRVCWSPTCFTFLSKAKN